MVQRIHGNGINVVRNESELEKLLELRDTIDSLIETLELQTNKQFLKAIKDAEREFEEGKTISFDELVEERELKDEF